MLGFEPEILRLQTGVIPMSYTRPNFKPPSLMGSEVEQDVLYCCFVTISLLGYRTLLKNDGRESLPFIQGPNLFKMYVYCSIHIYIYIYTFTNNLDKATDPELSLPNPVSFPDDRNRLFKTKGSNHPAICLSPPDPFYPNPSQKDPDSKH